MTKYDPNWLQKERAKLYAQQERALTHIEDKSKHYGPHEHSTMLCGKGWGAKGHYSISLCTHPSLTWLPTCRQCREIFLKSIGAEVDAKTGYPVGHEKATAA